VWAIGCVLGELLLRKPLFPGTTSDDQLYLYFDTLGVPGLSFRNRIRKQRSRELVESFCSEFDNNNNRAIEAEKSRQYFIDTFGATVSSFLFSCISWDPHTRSTAAELLNHKYMIDGEYGGDDDLEEIDIESVEAELMEEFHFERESYSRLQYTAELRREMSFDEL